MTEKVKVQNGVAADIKNTRELAKLLHEWSEGAYKQYEFEDMLEILFDAVRTVLEEGHSVRFRNLGVFYTERKEPYFQKGKLQGREGWYVQGYLRPKFKISTGFREHMKIKTRIDDDELIKSTKMEVK